MKQLTSTKNPQFRQFADLLEGRGIKKHQLFLLSGRKAVPEILSSRLKRVHSVLVTGEVFDLKVPAGVPIFNLSTPLFKELDVAGTHFPLLVLHLPEISEMDLSAPPEGLEVVSALSDPQNVGALVRVASAFGARRVILLSESATPFHPKSVRSSSSTVVDMTFAKGPSVGELVDGRRASHLVCLDQNGVDISQFSWSPNVRLVFGEEGLGLPDLLRKNALRIPIAAHVESLNAVSAASIAMYAYTTALKKQ